MNRILSILGLLAALAVAACTRPNLESTGGGYEGGAGEAATAPGDHAAPAESSAGH